MPHLFAYLFWHENRIRGFHQGGMRPDSLMCVPNENGFAIFMIYV
jgi:hypothetical protein